jgi:tRNA 5-methylaminomethyl-2-thiouridine biosynthesis bifunctional protein
VSLDKRCIVIGAGVAGAACARALVDRGWQVKLIDMAKEPCAAASGVPVGVVSCHASPDDNPLSQLTRAGLEATVAFAKANLIEGQDWSGCGVLERRLPDSSHAKKPWQEPDKDSVWFSHVKLAQEEQLRQARLSVESSHDLWQPQGAWIKPLALVRALLSSDDILFLGLHEVESMQKSPATGEWVLRIKHHIAIPGMGSSHTYTSESAPHVVLATGAHTPDFLNQVLYEPDMGLHPIAGQVSWGLQDDSDSQQLPQFAVNGHGSFVAHVPTVDGLAWYTGATFDRHQSQLTATEEAHVKNKQRLSELLPAVSDTLAHQWNDQAQIKAWNGVRCASVNRLPKLGPLDEQRLPGLHMLSALGSRGLTLALLCAQVVADRMEGKTPTLPEALLKAMQCELPEA